MGVRHFPVAQDRVGVLVQLEAVAQRLVGIDEHLHHQLRCILLGEPHSIVDRVLEFVRMIAIECHGVAQQDGVFRPGGFAHEGSPGKGCGI
ncbi:hypothetical protein G6F32_016144 [Rhizopus arrhizus]|nr:hypothetical protein G6F32_016144 [Rhizopus arrhizus]